MASADRQDYDYECGDEIRIVLLGKTGSGKSAVGNTILGVPFFETAYSATSVTPKCQMGEAKMNGKNIVVIDTPGFFDTRMKKAECEKELAKWQAMSSPGPHAVLFVLNTAERLTEKETPVIESVLQLFGEHIFKFIIVVFTRCDVMKMCGTSFDQYLNKMPQVFKNFLKKCHNRNIGFINEPGTGGEDQVSKLMQMIRVMTSMDQPYYTNQTIKDIEIQIMKEMDKRRTGEGELTQDVPTQQRDKIRKEIIAEGTFFGILFGVISSSVVLIAGAIRLILTEIDDKG